MARVKVQEFESDPVVNDVRVYVEHADIIAGIADLSVKRAQAFESDGEIQIAPPEGLEYRTLAKIEFEEPSWASPVDPSLSWFDLGYMVIKSVYVSKYSLYFVFYKILLGQDDVEDDPRCIYWSSK